MFTSDFWKRLEFVLLYTYEGVMKIWMSGVDLQIGVGFIHVFVLDRLRGGGVLELGMHSRRLWITAVWRKGLKLRFFFLISSSHFFLYYSNTLYLHVSIISVFIRKAFGIELEMLEVSCPRGSLEE